MPKFKYTGDYPAVFTGLSHGPKVVITAEGGDVVVAPEGSTVTLHPGDTLELTDIEYEHAHLVPFEQNGQKVTIAQLRDELTARGIEFDPKAKRADLEALLAPHLPVITDSGIVDQATSGDATEIDLTLTGDAGESTSSTSTEGE